MWIVNLTLNDGIQRSGQVLKVTRSRVVVQEFKGTSNINNQRTNCKFTNNVLKIDVPGQMLGWSFDGSSKVIDSSPNMFPETYLNINDMPINPFSRD